MELEFTNKDIYYVLVFADFEPESEEYKKLKSEYDFYVKSNLNEYETVVCCICLRNPKYSFKLTIYSQTMFSNWNNKTRDMYVNVLSQFISYSLSEDEEFLGVYKDVNYVLQPGHASISTVYQRF